MTSSSTGPATTPRAVAVRDLLDAMQHLVLEYAAMTEAERMDHLGHDADRITGKVARQLDRARQRLHAAPRGA